MGFLHKYNPNLGNSWLSQQTYIHQIPFLYNKLPLDLRQNKNITKFKAELTNYYEKESYKPKLIEKDIFILPESDMQKIYNILDGPIGP